MRLVFTARPRARLRTVDYSPDTLFLTLTSMPSSDGLRVTPLAATRTMPKSDATSAPYPAVPA